MFYLSCQKYVKIQFKFCYKLNSCPVQWNYSGKNVVLLEGEQLKKYKITIVAYHFHLLFLVIHSLFSNRTENVTNRLIRWTHLSILLSATLFHYGTWQGRNEIALLINSLKKFEIMRIQRTPRYGKGNSLKFSIFVEFYR